MKSFFTIALMLLCLELAHADVTDCQGIYVGQILVENGVTFRATFLNSPGDSSGSQWVYFNHWNAEDKKAALALLTTAKVAQQRVSLLTEELNGCGITTDQRFAKKLYWVN